MMKRALISVSDKQNIIEFAKGLVELDYEIVSTGGTLRNIQEAGIAAKAIDEVTGFPEIMDGRVKTLHPKVHGGLLAKRSNPDHMKQAEENGIHAIDMVVVNLYPFKQTLERDGVSKEEIIENIDIGGPTMLRSAAKNFEDVTVVVDPADYEGVLEALKTDSLDFEKRQKLAAKVFRHTANYDAMIAEYFMEETKEEFPETYTVTYEKVQDLRYGENPHQNAAFYKRPIVKTMSLATAKQLHGKELSYNNIQDANAALEILAEYDGQAAAVAVKHMNPCGIGVSDTISDAFSHAYDADPISIFGGIVALNKEVDSPTAEKLSNIFLEIVIAPGFSEKALEILTKKKNIRLLKLEMSDKEAVNHKLTSVNGGVLIQSQDNGKIAPEELTVATKRQPTEQELADLQFAWKAVKHVKSNAIVLAKDGQTIGVGAGQMNRVGSAKIAIEQAGEKAKGSVMSSDAFFPMPDTVEEAVKAGVTAIIQPGGSKRDQDSIDVCDEHGIAMVYTGMRHFKH
ncbi:bifunctional phosphoribosylaminoimidazolecarboxamide formyltransferase/IMP cyclohydrolase [Oceanobacillus salinisoli]|uniref:bifunctional phosphoribosylaminoimidazolecarboxamide formyltransferase/IMP cyclohydrolase n=1 Tax=Oceanobacillus salinisoli TaxID=2678611 RepID=UPI0012E2C47F|nr:bifunctional phosphoribosylaminoimidazolecarboxamide formyltransferase/IMP cyclohydrolase [Oceanobacillus salinisoli]